MRLAASTTPPVGAPDHATGGHRAGSPAYGPGSPQCARGGTAAQPDAVGVDGGFGAVGGGSQPRHRRGGL